MGDSGGFESIATGAKVKFEEARAKEHQKALVLLDLKNAYSAYKRAADKRALEVLAATDHSLHSHVLAHHPIPVRAARPTCAYPRPRPDSSTFARAEPEAARATPSRTSPSRP